MGSHRLDRLDTGDFIRWVQRLGYRDEMDFWSSISGLTTRGTVYDHMVYYLTAQGYRGTAYDQLQQFLMDQVSFAGGNLDRLKTMFDLADFLYSDGFNTGAAPVGVVDDVGNIVKDDDGNIVTN
jgi:hypothetical protein